MSLPATDIVLPVHGALDYTRECVRTLYEHTNSTFRLIVVDDYSDAETREFLYGPECLGRDKRNLYIRTNLQKWWTRASNIGLREARTEKAVLINSDCVVNDGWLEQMYDVWNEYAHLTPHRRLGLVGHAGRDDGKKWEETREPNYVTGHLLLMDMGALREVANARGTPDRYFDEIHQEAAHINSDRYICYEMNKLGMATVAAFQVAAGHHGGRSWGHRLDKTAAIRLEDLD